MSRRDYEARHAEFFKVVGALLESLGFRILKHEYMYQLFGSWYVEFADDGFHYRLVLDGRDDRLTIELDGKELASTNFRGDTGLEQVGNILREVRSNE